MEISAIVPLLNEAQNLELLYRELIEALEPTGRTFELIFIDDGSTDNSLSVLQKIQSGDPRVIVVSFRRNFGQTAAISAGFDHAQGDVIITLDADLQNDPRDIPKLLAKIDEGYDLVSGWRYDRKDKYISRRLPSIIANKVISTTTGVQLHDYGCTLKAFRKEITKNIRLYGEMHRFIPAIASGMGATITEIRVNHRPRRFGTSKYGISRTLRVILDLLTVKFMLSYATRPIQVFGFVGILCELVGVATFLILIVQRQFFDVALSNRPLFLLSILLIFIGLQFITLGLLGELQVRTYHEAQNKPIYVIRKIFKQSNQNKTQ